MKTKTCIIIPCHEPDDKLVHLLQHYQKLAGTSETPVILIDDGSRSSKAQEVFEKIKQQNLAHQTIRLEENKGKGCALKTGITYAQEQGYSHVVTADADGQHLPKDIVSISTLEEGQENLVVGKRHFGSNTPLRSKVGNFLTSLLLFLSYGYWMPDTQCGLRRIPRHFFQDALFTHGQKYDYEFKFLISKLRTKNITEHPISTIYEVGNPSSHFRPIRDSLLISFAFFRHVCGVMAITTLDFSIIWALMKTLDPVFSVLGARAVTVPLYYYVVKTKVWKTSGLVFKEVLAFLTLILFNIVITGWAFKIDRVRILLPNLFIYIVVSLLLFVFNFFICKKIFSAKN